MKGVLQRVAAVMKISAISLIFISLMWVAGSSMVYAFIIDDPATLHIGFGAGTACATGCAGDPNRSPGFSSIFDIYQTSDGAPELDQPVLLIIGVPNETDPDFFSHDSITGLSSYNPYPGTKVTWDSTHWTYGATTPKTGITFSGFAGTLDPREEVYGDVLGLTGDNSESFTNWTILDPTADYFGIYVFGLSAPLGGKGLLDITFASDTTVPVGSYVIAYGEDPPAGSTHIKAYSTPFTEAGFQCCERVPEPASLLLLGSGLAGLGLWGWRKFKGIKQC